MAFSNTVKRMLVIPISASAPAAEATDGAARAALLAAAATARATFGRAVAAFESLAADAPVGEFAAWLAAGGDAAAADSAAGAFIAGLAERAKGDAALAARLAELDRDALAVCFFGNSLVSPAPPPNARPETCNAVEF